MTLEEKKANLAENEELLNAENDAQSWFTFQNIYAILILNWQWFLLTMFIFLCGALIYLRYTDPTYSVSARMLIKEDKNARRNTGNMLANMQDLGFMTNSVGLENEMEILQSNVLLRSAVKDLKLYTEYYSKGYVKKNLTYGNQPINVDLDPVSLDSLDKLIMDETRTMEMSIVRKEQVYEVNGLLKKNGKPAGSFLKQFKQLPASCKTAYGTLTFTKNVVNKADSLNGTWIVKIMPPMLVARKYLAAMNVAATSKQTDIAEITLKDANPKRGIDFLRALVNCYNRQANADKNEIALKTEEFINERIEKINEELGKTESKLQSYKKVNEVVDLQLDAAQTLQMTNEYSTKLAEASSQIQLLDYLRQYVDNPANQYSIIPSNVGMTDAASTALITSYNQTVQDRNRYLQTASAHAPQVLTLTSTLDQLQVSIINALTQARRSAEIQRKSVQDQYSKYQSRVGKTPDQERVLTEIGRQQEVRSGLYLMLLQKREENSISLAATADKGKLIDDPQYLGIVSPKRSIILLAALVLGFALPLLVLFLISFFRYRIEGRDDVMKLTSLPIVADVPVASDSVKTTAGIVVQANKNNQIDEIFRSLRTNIQFLMKENEKVILFTSSTSGEGKTFLAANLAVSFALLGKKVVLCGLDIRKPALGKLFNVSDRKAGATALLVKNEVTTADVRAQITPSGVNDNLDLLLAGPTPPNPTELLARRNMQDIIEILKQQYDYVILDTAPVGLVTDTLQIAKFTNVSCYVCRADYTPKANLGVVNTLAKENKLPNTCIILNGVDMSKKKYGYYYGYGKYGKYGRYGYGRYGYGKYGYGNYGNYGNYADSRYSNKNDDSIKK
ncbi:polysaccharide biosynthesis tyrosine autokinase [Prevotella sp. E15-22]|uniref:GumC family protein n=1 Tax=Prevotella sp. E15-22 TaxID=2937774 RepID=UPI0020586CD3|nr:tyrosine-protein kinase [Prevotella sp. E15-22]UPS45384.1 polysaccharide biosynthesis tyrosine autokinase [Prevotella sp. E15-22]